MHLVLLLLAGQVQAVECLTHQAALQRQLFGPMPVRPTEGGMFSFDSSDEVEHLDASGGTVRVHYSVSGPNVTVLDDDDGDGLPDFPELVGETTEEVFEVFAAAGFRAPLSEQDMGLGELGGSYAFDVYIVDFGGQGDGVFSTDACTSDPNVCSGFFAMDNDFRYSGYSSVESAVDTLTSHELFHAVQAAYESESPVWYGEGSAEWAERLLRPDSEDFLWYADAYLDDVERSLDEPPTGPVATFSYATCLWWDFMAARLGNDAMVAFQESLEWDGADKDTLTEMISTIQAYGSDIATEWSTFARWNLATKGRAGSMESHEYAAEIGPVPSSGSGQTLQDDNRFYPLAASYYQLNHPGGELYFSHEDDATGVLFSLHPVKDGEADGQVEDAIAEWAPTDPSWVQLSEDLPAGGYWLVGTHAANASSSQKFEFCLGDAAAAEVCLPEPGDTAVPDDTGEDEDPGGCSCAASTTGPALPAALGLLASLGAAIGRRRRAG